MPDTTVVVDGLVATDENDIDLSRFDEAIGFALDQRAFGPRRLLGAVTDADGRVRSLAHAPRTDPIDLALRGCIHHLGAGATAAVAFNDERAVDDGRLPPDIPYRLWQYRLLCQSAGIQLVDWFACDDQAVRSFKLAVEPDAADDWWDVPPPAA
jgi:hypothetical protein